MNPVSTPIDSFTGRYRFLSNFYPAEVVFGLHVYPSVEHAYQAAKEEDEYGDYRCHIRLCSTPGQAKRLGRQAQLRPDWEDIKLKVMEDLVRQKFYSSDLDLGARLIETAGRDLIEGNTWGDRFWGKCRGVGHNHLGKILMKVRKELLLQRLDDLEQTEQGLSQMGEETVL